MSELVDQLCEPTAVLILEVLLAGILIGLLASVWLHTKARIRDNGEEDV